MHGSGEIATYIHAGKIGVMVEVTCESDFIAQSEVFQALIHDLAMQVAANDPKFIRKANVPPEIVEHERESYRTQAAAGACLGRGMTWVSGGSSLPVRGRGSRIGFVVGGRGRTSEAMADSRSRHRAARSRG